MKILEFEDWDKKLNIDHDLRNFFDNVWNTRRFPWEDEVVEKLEVLKEILTKLQDSSNKDRYEKGSFCFNIKIRRFPDNETLQKKYELTEEEITVIWERFLDDQVRMLIEMLEEDYDWAGSASHHGRSGGWVCVEVPGGIYDRQDIVEDWKGIIVEALELYDEDVSEEEHISDEEIEKKKHQLTGSNFGLGGPFSKKVNSLKEKTKLLLDTLNKVEEKVKNFEKDLVSIENLINESLNNLPNSFEEYLSENVPEQ